MACSTENGDTAVHTIELINRLDNLQHQRGREHGLGLEL